MRGGATVPQFRAATAALGQLRDFAAFARKNDPAQTAEGVQPNERGIVAGQVKIIDGWLDKFIVSLGVKA